MVKLQSAYDQDNLLVHIDNANRKSGDIYYCPDPNCKSQLVVKKGKKRAAHFAHKADSTPCYGLETSLHFLSKEVLSKSKTLSLPPAMIWKNEILNIVKPHIKRIVNYVGLDLPYGFYKTDFFWGVCNPSLFTLVKACEISLEQYYIKVESYLGKIKPDLILTHKTSGRNLHVEVAVTHKIEDNKKQMIKENDYAFIEMDFSKIYIKNTDYTFNAIKSLFESYSFTWVNVPNREKIIQKNSALYIEEFQQTLLRIKSFYELALEPFFRENLSIINIHANPPKFIYNNLLDDNFQKEILEYSFDAHLFFFSHFKKSEYYLNLIAEKKNKLEKHEEWRKQFYGAEYYHRYMNR